MNIHKSIKIFFLVNANQKIGGGHLVRCRLIAEELKNKLIDSVFIFTNTDQSFESKIEKEFEVINLELNRAATSAEIIKQINVFENNFKLLVIDSDDENYYKEQFQKEIMSAGVRLMIITVNPNFNYYSNILLNQNIVGLSQEYKTSHDTIKLLGPKYFILDKKFRLNRKKEKNQKPPFNFFIAFGGGDYYNLTGKILSALEIIPEYCNTVNVVVGGLNKHLPKIKEQIEQTKKINVKLHININNIEEIMSASNIAITSSGLTFWELATMEIPSFMIAASDRELAITEYLSKEKYCYQLGEFKNLGNKNEMANNIKKVFDSGINNTINIGKLTKQINVCGVQLVAEKMISIFEDD